MAMATPQETFEAYIAAWNTADPAECQQLLEQCWAEDGVYCDPQTLAQGRPALQDVIAGFQSNFAGSRIEPRSGLDIHHNRLRFAWVMVSRGGKTLTEGIDFGELDQDNRLKSITGFFGPLPSLP